MRRSIRMGTGEGLNRIEEAVAALAVIATGWGDIIRRWGSAEHDNGLGTHIWTACHPMAYADSVPNESRPLCLRQRDCVPDSRPHEGVRIALP
jgi:hypothetical protein